MRRQPLTEMAVRLAIEIALAEALKASRASPSNIFWLHALRCPGCGRHVAGLAITASSEAPRPKYVIATIANGEVIPRTLRRH
jgi:Ni,Fe-hydrogenase I small subunit